MSRDTRITHAFGCQLNKGKVRKENEDSIGAAKIKLVSEDAKRSIGLYMVADGIAGMAEGAQASKLAVQTAMEAMMTYVHQHDNPEDIEAWLRLAADEAHYAIRRQQNGNVDNQGTTLVMATIIEDDAYIANIGDSRAYLIHNNELNQITRDHTAAQSLVDHGVIEQEEADHHPLSHVLSQAVGIREIQCDSYRVRLKAGDSLLLCSDGLYGYVDASTILDIVSESTSPQAASTALMEAANKAGGKDNIAVIVVQVHERNDL